LATIKEFNVNATWNMTSENDLKEMARELN